MMILVRILHNYKIRIHRFSLSYNCKEFLPRSSLVGKSNQLKPVLKAAGWPSRIPWAAPGARLASLITSRGTFGRNFWIFGGIWPLSWARSCSRAKNTVSGYKIIHIYTVDLLQVILLRILSISISIEGSENLKTTSRARLLSLEPRSKTRCMENMTTREFFRTELPFDDHEKDKLENTLILEPFLHGKKYKYYRLLILPLLHSDRFH